MLSFELAGIKVTRKGLNPKLVERDFQRQLTDTTRWTRTQISKQVRAKYNVKAGLLGGGRLSRVRIRKVRLGRALVYRSTMLGLDRMSPTTFSVNTNRGKRRAVRVMVKRGHRKFVKGGFKGRSRDGKRDFIYRRVVNSSGQTEKTSSGKDKLERLYTISLAHMVGQTPLVQLSDPVAKHFFNGFEKRLAKQKPRR